MSDLLMPPGQYSIKTEHLLQEIDETGRALGSRFGLSEVFVARRGGGLLRIHAITADAATNSIVIEVRD